MMVNQPSHDDGGRREAFRFAAWRPARPPAAVSLSQNREL
jgi:hypothetical protein